MLIYTCPKCGADLQEIVLTSYPPQYQKHCINCGWSSPTEKSEIIRVPYVKEMDIKSSMVKSITTKNDYCKNCYSNPDNGGSGICNCTLGLPIALC